MKFTALITLLACLLAFAAAEPRRRGKWRHGGKKGWGSLHKFKTPAEQEWHHWEPPVQSEAPAETPVPQPEAEQNEVPPAAPQEQEPAQPATTEQAAAPPAAPQEPEPEPQQSEESTSAPEQEPSSGAADLPSSLCGAEAPRGTMVVSDSMVYTCAPMTGGDYCLATEDASLNGQYNNCSAHSDCGEGGYCIQVQGDRQVCWRLTVGTKCNQLGETVTDMQLKAKQRR